jgi:hypothetical protein
MNESRREGRIALAPNHMSSGGRNKVLSPRYFLLSLCFVVLLVALFFVFFLSFFFFLGSLPRLPRVQLSIC